MILAFFAAAAAAFAAFFVHVFLGGRLVVRPLLKARDITLASCWLMYFCWHIVSLLLLFMAAAFVWAGLGAPWLLGAGLTVFSALVLALCGYVCWRAKFPPQRVPPFVLFATMTLLGALGAVS